MIGVVFTPAVVISSTCPSPLKSSGNQSAPATEVIAPVGGSLINGNSVTVPEVVIVPMWK